MLDYHDHMCSIYTSPSTSVHIQMVTLNKNHINDKIHRAGPWPVRSIKNKSKGHVCDCVALPEYQH